MIFQDRYDAAQSLIPLLSKYAHEPGVVLAIPKGGVPIGSVIAQKFGFPLELLLTKKIGHPVSKELAIGAVSLSGEVIDDRNYVPEEYIDREIQKIRASLRERYKAFMGEHKLIDLRDKTVIIVDDGIATGNTILASIRMIREMKPRKIIIAVPVAPRDTVLKLEEQVDEVVCSHIPKRFAGVGQFYRDFSDVSDKEVIALIQATNHRTKAA